MKHAGLGCAALATLAMACEKKAAPAAPAKAGAGTALAPGSGATPTPTPTPTPAAPGAKAIAPPGEPPSPTGAPVPGPIAGTDLPGDVPLPAAFGKGFERVAAQGFRDGNGANQVFLGQRRGSMSNMLMAVHVVRDAAGAERVLREVKDLDECDADASQTGFRPVSLRVTDLDADGVGEVSFSYDVGCGGEGGAAITVAKTLLLERGEKYILRVESATGGEGYGDDSGYGGGGSSRAAIEPAEGKWPAAFLAFARERAGV